MNSSIDYYTSWLDSASKDDSILTASIERNGSSSALMTENKISGSPF